MQPAVITRLLWLIGLLAVVGVAVSAIALYHHYGTSPTSFCTFGENFNCDMVNRSTYSTVLGVPVALIGIAGYVFLLALVTVYRRKPETPSLLLLASGAGLAFALYLTYIEAFVLAVWCVLCLFSLAIISLITVFSIALKCSAGAEDLETSSS